MVDSVAAGFGAISDDFSGAFLDPEWEYKGVAGTATLGSDGTDDYVVIDSPTGAAVSASDFLTSPRLMQGVSNTDFQITAGFLTDPDQVFQEHGLLVVQNEQNFIRFDTAFTSVGTTLIAGFTQNGTTEFRIFNAVADPQDLRYLRLTREGNTWTFETSGDGSVWQEWLTTDQGLFVWEVGVFAGSIAFGGTPPGYEAKVDFFQVSGAEILSEDGGGPATPDPTFDPIPGDDAFNVDSRDTVSGNVLVNDEFFDGALSLAGIAGGGIGAVVTLPSGARVSADAAGQITYDPNGAFDFLAPNQSATDTFTYTVIDGTGGEAEGQVTITVTNGNNAPVAQDDVITGQEDDTLTGSVFAANGGLPDSDADDDPFTVTAVNGVAANVGQQIGTGNGWLTLNADGSFAYLPDPDFAGTDSFTYTITDPDGVSDTASVLLVLAEVNDDPIAQNDVFSINAGQVLSGFVSSDNGNGPDTDAEGDTLTYSQLTTTLGGSLTFDPGTGFFFYRADSGFSGTDTFAYRVSDGRGGTDTATVTIDVIETVSTYSAGVQTAQQAEDAGGDTTTFTFTVTREGATQGSGTVAYAVGGGAVDPADTGDLAGGSFPSGTLSFSPGEVSKTVTVTVADDFVPEADETLTLTLSNPTNTAGDAELGTASATATILNDDEADITGNNGRDKLKGSDDDDVIVAGGGDDRVKADDGDDVILGGDGDDRLDGGNGDDIIMGDDGDDRIKDKDGDNRIDGGAGDDRLTAGKGDDIFVVKAGNDVDSIKKFDKKGSDQIDLTAFEGMTFDLFEEQADQDGKDLVWEAPDGTELILEKIDLDELSSRDFIFA